MVSNFLCNFQHDVGISLLFGIKDLLNSHALLSHYKTIHLSTKYIG